MHLHCAQKISDCVVGFLLGAKGQAEAVVDVLPICQSQPIGPIFEVAGGIAETLFGGDKEVLGLYYYDGEKGNAFFVEKICATIKANNSGKSCVVLKIAADKLEEGASVLAVEGFVDGVEKKVKVEAAPGDSAAQMNAVLDSLLLRSLQFTVKDVASHMTTGRSKDNGAGEVENKSINLFVKGRQK
jgi:hypothetical protein